MFPPSLKFADILCSVDIDKQPEQNVTAGNSLFFVAYLAIMQIVVFSLLIGIIIDRFNAVSGKGILTERQRDFKQLTQNILTGADHFCTFRCVSVSVIPPHLACVNLVSITPRLLSPGVCLLVILQLRVHYIMGSVAVTVFCLSTFPLSTDYLPV